MGRITILFLLFTVVKTQAQEGDSSKVAAFYQSFNIDLEKADNPALYQEVYRWLGTPYRAGGRTERGIDCSDFVSVLYDKIYHQTISGSAGDMSKQVHFVHKNKIAEGDLLFFKIKKGRISHVGIYLQHNKFAHATTHGGVMIDDMDTPYYKRSFYKAGRQ